MNVGTMQAKVITVSDGVFHGAREDKSGVALDEVLTAAGWTVVNRIVVADGVESVRDAIAQCADGFSGVIVTTGGTGFGPRDLTPEGTALVLERQAPGLAEAMRLANPPLGRLSRGVAGTIGKCVVLNTPGSPKGCIECLHAVIDVLPHAVSLMTGETTIH
jgi:molybdopterin adenylyltransferase